MEIKMGIICKGQKWEKSMKPGANGWVNAVEAKAVTKQASLWKLFLLLFVCLPRMGGCKVCDGFYQQATRDMCTSG